MPFRRGYTLSVDADGFYDVTCEGRRLRIAFKEVNPVVHAAGVALEWEAIVITDDGRDFHGYGTDRAMAFANVRDAALGAGVEHGVVWDMVAGAVLLDTKRP